MDEVNPISCTGRGPDFSDPDNASLNDVLGRYSLTLVDTLDVFAVIGDREGFERAVNLTLSHVSFDIDSRVSVFEVTIRMLGGLLSAHQLASDPHSTVFLPWYKAELLDLALDLGRRLLPAFKTPTGIPYSRAYAALMLHVKDDRGLLYKNVNMFNGGLYTTWVDSLSAFFPGLQVQVGDVAAAERGHRLFYGLWRRFGGIPERYDFHQRALNIPSYPLRPEFIESTYFLYKATKNPYYLHVGEMILHSFATELFTHSEPTCPAENVADSEPLGPLGRILKKEIVEPHELEITSGLEFLNEKPPTTTTITSATPTKVPVPLSAPSEVQEDEDDIFWLDQQAHVFRMRIYVPPRGDSMVDSKAEPAAFGAQLPRGEILEALARPLMRTSLNTGKTGSQYRTVLSTGCNVYPPGMSFVGHIAIVQRGGCPFITKVQLAEEAGAVALAVVGHDDHLFVMTRGSRATSSGDGDGDGDDDPTGGISIPSFAISAEAGSALLADSLTRQAFGSITDAPSAGRLALAPAETGVEWAGAEIPAGLAHMFWDEDEWRVAEAGPGGPAMLQYGGKSVSNLLVVAGRRAARSPSTSKSSSSASSPRSSPKRRPQQPRQDKRQQRERRQRGSLANSARFTAETLAMVRRGQEVFRGVGVLHKGQAPGCILHCPSAPRTGEVCCGGGA
ncbi:alpha mannosidase-like protein [Cladochytrium tenue]|nr:alpha mannosidase-like protein [Cladochytrium tenue]